MGGTAQTAGFSRHSGGVPLTLSKASQAVFGSRIPDSGSTTVSTSSTATDIFPFLDPPAMIITAHPRSGVSPSSAPAAPYSGRKIGAAGSALLAKLESPSHCNGLHPRGQSSSPSLVSARGGARVSAAASFFWVSSSLAVASAAPRRSTSAARFRASISASFAAIAAAAASARAVAALAREIAASLAHRWNAVAVTFFETVDEDECLSRSLRCLAAVLASRRQWSTRD